MNPYAADFSGVVRCYTFQAKEKRLKNSKLCTPEYMPFFLAG